MAVEEVVETAEERNAIEFPNVKDLRNSCSIFAVAFASCDCKDIQ